MKRSRWVPSWTSSPAVRSPKTWENLQSSCAVAAPDVAGAASPSPPPFIVFFLIYNREIRQKKKSEIIYHASIWNWDLAWISRIKEQSSSKNQCSLFLVLHPFQAWRVRSIQRLEFPLSLSLLLSLCVSDLFLFPFCFFFCVAENRGEENDAAGHSFLARFVVDI